MKTSRYLLLAAALLVIAFPAFAAGPTAEDLKTVTKIDIESQRTDMNSRTNVTVKGGKEFRISGDIGTWSISGAKLRIKPGGDIVLTLPADHAMRELEIEILSGNIRVDGILLGELETVATTGTTTIRNTEAEDRIECTSTQGRMVFENVSSPVISADSVSGAISFRGEAGKLRLSSLLGELDAVTGRTPDLTLCTTHGEMLVRTSLKAPKIDFDSLFGNCHGPESTDKGYDMKIRAHSLNSNLTVELI